MRFFNLASAVVLAVAVNAQNDGDVSPPKYPSPWMRGGNGWDDAYTKAKLLLAN